MVEKLSPDQYFRLSDGSLLKDVSDLKKFLRKDDDELFFSHVDGERNDFYNWVNDCMLDKELAAAIKDSKDPDSMLSAIESIEARRHAEDNPQPHREEGREPEGFSSGDLFSGSSTIKEMMGSSGSSSHASETGLKEQDIKGAIHEDKASRRKPVKKSSRRAPSATAKTSKTSSKMSKERKGSKKSAEKSTDYKEDFDYSFDLDSEREDLDKIRERIARLNEEISSSSSGSSSAPSSKAQVKEKKRISKADTTAKTQRKKGVKSSATTKNSKDDHSEANKPSRRHSSKRSKKEKVDVPLIKEPKSIPEKTLRKDAQDSKKHNVRYVDQDEDADIDHEMKSLYGQSINEKKKEKKEKRQSKKRNPLFKRLMGRLTRAEKVVEKELPNLHEMEHGKKAQEVFNPYVQIDHPWNYHNHGFPDFVKGLLIGMLLGMLFLALFL